MTNFVIKGGRELAQAMSQLPIKVEKQVLLASLKEGAKEYQDEARKNVPKKSGKLYRSIRVVGKQLKGGAEAKVIAGGKKAFYAHMVEFGTAPHQITIKNAKKLKFRARDGRIVQTLTVNHTGAIAKPFMRPALDNSTQEAINAVAEEARNRLRTLK